MDSLPFHIVDLGVGVVLLVSAFFAFARGFVHEVLSVVGWVGAIFAAIYGLPYVKPHARDLIEMELIADIAAGAFIFLITLLLLSLFTSAIARQVKDSSLNALDRALGFLFGLVRGAVLVCLVFIAAEWILVTPPEPEEGQAQASGQEQAGQKPVGQDTADAADGEEPPPDPLAWIRTARSLPLIETGAALLATLVPSENGSPKAAVKLRSRAKKLIEGEKVLRNLISPVPKSEPADAAAGYSKKEREDMQRLMEGNN